MTLLNPDVVKNRCWRRYAGCKIRSMTCVTSARRDQERDQGQHFGDDTPGDPGQILDSHAGIETLDRGQGRPPCDHAEGDWVRVFAKTSSEDSTDASAKKEHQVNKHWTRGVGISSTLVSVGQYDQEGCFAISLQVPHDPSET